MSKKYGYQANKVFFSLTFKMKNRVPVFFFILAISVTHAAMGQSIDDCLMCHSDTSLSMEREGKNISIFADRSILHRSVHSKFVCVACHTGFDPQNVPHKAKITPVNCLQCHSDAPAKHPFHAAVMKNAASQSALLLQCKQCHGTHAVAAMKNTNASLQSRNVIELCGACHAVEKERYLNSVHGKASAGGIAAAPDCVSCHQNKITGLAGTKDSVAIKIAQEKLCLSCHLDNPDVRSHIGLSAGFIAAYEKSVHGSALLKGNASAANCVNCHGSHSIQRSDAASSSVNRNNIPLTCAKCHAGIKREYDGSIHAQSAASGNKDAPVCTNCHGEHNILAPSNPDSRVAAQNVSQQVCSPCHSSVLLSEKYGIASDRFKTYSSSFHGLAVRAGNVAVANCASCHGAHNIKPSFDSTSSVNKANLVKTCGKCHPGANDRFTIGSIHITAAQKEEPLIYWVTLFYVTMIASVIGGMFLHNLLDFYRKSKRRLLIRRGLESEEHFGHALYVRMTLSERIQHASLMVSFFTLVFTGFMLRYPDAFWVVSLRSLSENVFMLRGLIHRIAAAAMVSVSLYHCFYVFFTERGKQLIRDLLPAMQDFTDAGEVLKYNFGFSKIKPKLGRFSYIEKSEYWALVWGVVVMGITGIILWFDNTFMGLLTKLGWDIARIIHFYEAWLAFLAILIWHIYYVIFNPDIYPMNLAWIKGTITETEMGEEHLRELEQLKRRKLIDEAAVIPVDEGEKVNQKGVKPDPKNSHEKQKRRS
jgi:cytochrome b subunit of formate dehydrogenase